MDKKQRKKEFLLIFVILALSLSFIIFSSTEEDKNKKRALKILTYSSFQDYYGPGPELIKNFEKICDCRVKMLNAGSAGLILQRLNLKKEEIIDLIIGFDQFSIKAARGIFTWKPVSNLNIKWHPKMKNRGDRFFIPYNWAPMTFIYRKGEITPPKNWKDLLEPKYKKKLSLSDPRQSTPGMQFLSWITENQGQEKAISYFEKLNKSVRGFSPSWSKSYGVFKAKKASMVFSYLTSPIYHWKEENNRSYQPVMWKKPVPVQVEFVSISSRCGSCDLAEQFVKFLLSPESQKIIMNKNYMFPAVAGVEKGTLFEKLLKDHPFTSIQYTHKLDQETKNVLKSWTDKLKRKK